MNVWISVIMLVCLEVKLDQLKAKLENESEKSKNNDPNAQNCENFKFVYFLRSVLAVKSHSNKSLEDSRNKEFLHIQQVDTLSAQFS